MEEKGFSISNALKIGWNSLTDNLLFLVAFVLVVTIIPMTPSIASNFYMDQYPFTGWVLITLGWVLSTVGQMALYRVSLILADGKKPKWKNVTDKVNLFFNFFFSSLIYGLMVGVGLLLFIVPGIILALRYAFYGFNVIDKNMGPFEALKQSGKQTYGVKWDLFGLFILVLFINLLGLLCFGIGIFVTLPVTWVAWAWAYRKVTDTVQETPEIEVQE